MSSGNEELSHSSHVPIESNVDDDAICGDATISDDATKEVISIDIPNTTQAEELNETITEKETDKNINNSDDSTSDQPISSKPNRELKSILALSKEANLDTNIAHKRKSIETAAAKQLQKSELTIKRRYSVDSSSENVKTDKRQSRVSSTQLTHRSQRSGSAISCLETESSSEISENENVQENKTNKRKRESLYELTVGGVLDEGRRSKRSSSISTGTMNNKKKDFFCWRCHHEDPTISCETCPRSFHQKCLRQSLNHAPTHWICPECVTILKAENVKDRSPAMQEMSLEHLCGLLKFALKRMLQVNGCEPFIHPVSDTEFPEYKTYVVQPMDLTCLEKNIKENLYGSTQAFEADTKWILHNSIIFNTYQSKLTTIAKAILKICKQEMAEIENCASCYLNANTKKKTWFVEVCPKPHLLVWAKLKGFPYWPAKAMRTNSGGMVDVRFFGAHDRAWVHYKECFLYSLKDPNANKQKRNDINESIRELSVHIENLKKVYGEFNYASYRTTFQLDNELKQLKILLPKYEPITSREKIRKIVSQQGDASGSSTPNNIEEEGEESDDDRETDEDTNKVNNDNKSNSDIKDISHSTERKNEKISSSEESDDSYKGSGKSYKNIEDAEEATNKQNIHDDKKLEEDECAGFPEKIKVPVNSVSRKRQFYDDCEIPTKLSRHSSDQSIKSDSSHFSNLSDKINKVEIPENVEITLGNDTNGGLNISENLISENDSSEVAIESKRKPVVQLNISGNENQEFTISPQSKAKIADQLMKKLTEPLGNCSNVELVKRQICVDETIEKKAPASKQNITETDLVLEKFKDKNLTILEELTELSSDVEIFEVHDKLEKKSGSADVKLDQMKQLQVESIKQKRSKSVDIADSEKSLKKVCKTISETDLSVIESQNSAEEAQDKESSITSTSEESMQIVETSNPDMEINAETKELDDSNKTSPKTPIKEKLSSNARNQDKCNNPVASSCGNNVPEEINPKHMKIVNIEDIKKKNLDVEKPSSNSLLENSLNKEIKMKTYERKKTATFEDADPLKTNSNTSIIVKSDSSSSSSSSEDELSDAEYMELKRKYLSALNISEKFPGQSKKRNVQVTTKIDGRKINRVNNLVKVIDDVATHYSKDHENEEITITRIPKKKEIFVKPLSKIQVPKQRARKSFPSPSVRSSNLRKDSQKCLKSTLTPMNVTPLTKNTINISSNSSKPSETTTLLTQPQTFSTGLTVLPPNQPITYSTNMGNPVLTMVQRPVCPPAVNTTTTNSTEHDNESQNHIPQNEERSNVCKETSSSSTPICTVENVVTVSDTTNNPSTPQLITDNTQDSESDSLSNNQLEEPEYLNLIRPLNETLGRTPPKLTPRPPGPLSNNFDVGLPSSAGPVTSKINSISHKLNDYLRGMLVELLQEIGYTDTPEAEITKLKLENEELKHKHAEEILEIKKNINSIIRDMQKSITEERNRIVDETRSACEAECLKRVEEAKSKQWCASCSKEAQFYCCWNTSYCDYPCQQKHWPQHMSKCTQNLHNSQIQATIAAVGNKPPPQPLMLQPNRTTKGFTTKTLIAKPTKLFVNKSGNNRSSFNILRPSTTNHITLVESTPGNYELLGNGPISVGGKFITGISKIKTGNVMSVTSVSNIGSTGFTNIAPKQSISKQSTVTTPKTITATVMSDDECE